MTREALRSGAISVDSVSLALMQGKGDLFVTAAILGVTFRELDRYLAASPELQAFLQAIGTVKEDPNYRKLSDEQFRDHLERITQAYKLEATEVIHDMATMDFDTAAMAEVKLKAAIALKGSSTVQAAGNGEQSQILAELNALYVEAAPRIKSVRAVQIEYEE